jgi:hypothetical protein
MKKEAKIKARDLRTQGISINKIASSLRVSKGTVSYWVRDIVLTEDQRIRLAGNRAQRLLFGSQVLSRKYMALRARYQAEGRHNARTLGKAYAMACMLFWAEGSRARQSVVFTNTDSDMMLFFVKFLKKYFKCKPSDFSLTLNAYLDNGLSAVAIENFWVKKLRLRRTCLRKSQFKLGNGQGGKYPYGVCTIRIHDVRLVQLLYGSIQELVNISRPGWLDYRR